VDTEGVFNVTGARIEKLISMTNFAQPDSWERVHSVFKTIGLDKALKKAGAVQGDMVRIRDCEFQWSDAPRKAGKPGKFAYKYKKYNEEYG